jgi:hypothetical protein
VKLRSDTERSKGLEGGDPKSPENEPLPSEKPNHTTHKDSPCLDNKRALTDYADALDKLWQP